MNVFNRVLVSLISIAITVSSFLICIRMLEIFSFQQIGISLPWVEWILSGEGSDLQTRLITVSSSLGVFILSSILLFFEIKPIFLKEKYFLLSQDELGKIEISENCINRFINQEAKKHTFISQSQSSIKEKSDGFHIKNLVTVRPSTNIGQLGKELQESLKKTMQEKLGLYISTISVETRLKTSAVGSKKYKKLEKYKILSSY